MSKKRTAAAASLNTEVVSISDAIGTATKTEISEQVKKLVGAIACPHLYTRVPIRYPDEQDPTPTFCSNTTTKMTPDFPQLLNQVYPSTHQLAGKDLYDLSGSALMLSGNLMDEATLCLGIEVKNNKGNNNAYRALSPQSTYDFTIPCGLNAVTVSGTNPVQTIGIPAVPQPLDASLMVPDQHIVTDALAGTTPLTAGTSTLTFASYHGDIAAVGHSVKYGGRTYVPTSGNIYAKATSGNQKSVNPIGRFDASVNAANSALAMSSCYYFFAGSPTGTNTAGLLAGDEVNIVLYGHNEGNETEYGNILINITADVPEDGFVAAIPQYLFDWCRPVVTISVQGAAPAATTSIVNKTRNIRWGVSHNGGTWAQSMAPGFGSPTTLANFTESRLIANAIDAENWTSEFSIGSKAGVVGGSGGSYFQNLGFDQAMGGKPLYDTIITKPDEDDDIAKFGNHCYLCPQGSSKFAWRDNIDTPSTLATGGVLLLSNVGAYHDLEGKNYNVFCYVSPGVNTAGTQTAQQLQLTQTVICEWKTEQIWLQRFDATDDIESWIDAVKLLGKMKHSARRPDMAYYWSTLGWKKDNARKLQDAGPMVVW